MLLEGGLRWHALSLSPHDMDFVALKAAAARDIALAFGVPPVLIGLPGDGTYSTIAKPSERSGARGCCRSPTRYWAGSRRAARLRLGLSLGVDMNGLPALIEDRAMLWDRIATADFPSRGGEADDAGVRP